MRDRTICRGMVRTAGRAAITIRNNFFYDPSVEPTMLSVLNKIPASLWVIIASITGTLSALAGVLLTNRAHDRRFKAQLAHDLEVKNSEREMACRKEVFLQVADATFRIPESCPIHDLYYLGPAFFFSSSLSLFSRCSFLIASILSRLRISSFF